MAVPAFAHNGHHKSDKVLGLELLQDLADIPQQRLRDLNCRRNTLNSDLCRIERVRKRSAERNLDLYNGRLQYVKNAILADINDRDNRRFDLNCGSRHNPNRDLCRYENIVLNELNNIFLVEVNQAIRHNKRHRDQARRDRIERERRERARRDRIERERRQREKDRLERERRKRKKDRIERERRSQREKDRIKRERRQRERDRARRDDNRRDDNRPTRPRRPRRG